MIITITIAITIVTITIAIRQVVPPKDSKDDPDTARVITAIEDNYLYICI